MAKKRIVTPFYDVMTGEQLDLSKDQQAPIPADSGLDHQAFTVVDKEDLRAEQDKANKQDPLEYIMENYGEALKNRDVPGLLCGLIKEIVLLRMSK